MSSVEVTDETFDLALQKLLQSPVFFGCNIPIPREEPTPSIKKAVLKIPSALTFCYSVMMISCKMTCCNK